jgi:hypothetical protein
MGLRRRRAVGRAGQGTYEREVVPLTATEPPRTAIVLARYLAVLALLASLGCNFLPGRGGAPTREPGGTAGSPTPAADRQPTTSAPTAEPAPAPTNTAVSASGDEALSESAYKDAVRPLMRRLRDNGRDSLSVLDQAQGRSSPGDAPDRAARLRGQVEEIEGELNALKPPSTLQRAHDDLLRSAASQKEFLDRQIEAYDNWSNRDAAFRALDRAGDSLGQAMNRYGDAAAALGINP